MSIKLDDSLVQLIQESETAKIIATVTRNRTPYVSSSPHLYVNDQGQLVHLELLETSKTNRNLVYSIWFNGKVAVYVQGNQGEFYVITATPVKSIISGPVFKEHYINIRQKLGDVGLVAVWLLQPEEVIEDSFAKQKEYEESNRKSFIHLDRLVRKQA